MNLGRSLTRQVKIFTIKLLIMMQRRKTKLLHLQSLLASLIINVYFKVEQDASVSESSPHIANIGEHSIVAFKIFFNLSIQVAWWRTWRTRSEIHWMRFTSEKPRTSSTAFGLFSPLQRPTKWKTCRQVSILLSLKSSGLIFFTVLICEHNFQNQLFDKLQQKNAQTNWRLFANQP